MIQYINKKDIYGPFMKRQDVYLPHAAEVTSDKFTNMRYQDKSSAKHNLDEFLKSAYAKQMKELNGTTGRRWWTKIWFGWKISTEKYTFLKNSINFLWETFLLKPF